MAAAVGWKRRRCFGFFGRHQHPTRTQGWRQRMTVYTPDDHIHFCERTMTAQEIGFMDDSVYRASLSHWSIFDSIIHAPQVEVT